MVPVCVSVTVDTSTAFKLGRTVKDSSGTLSCPCSALNGALESRPADRLHLSYEPQFDRDILVADIRFEVRSSGARLAWPAVVLLLTFPYFGAWRCWRAWRREARADT